jgi:hypothetical protein
LKNNKLAVVMIFFYIHIMGFFYSKTIIPFTFTGILRSSVSFFLYTELHMSNNVINKKMFREHLPESPISDQTSNSRYQDIPTRHPATPANTSSWRHDVNYCYYYSCAS